MPPITENAVVDAVCLFLEAEGRSIESRCGTSARGVDISATRGGERLAIEAKGATSSKATTARYGKPFSAAQVLDHVAKAIYAAMKARSQGFRSAVALPDDAPHQRRIAAVAGSLTELGITVYFVDASGAVRIAP
ncbi:MAG: hypothetical protein K2X46_14785 [Roseomonas sp.]|nr:hypothetical protein [Roseomonas sp.]